MINLQLFEQISEIIVNDFDDITIMQYMKMDEDVAVETGQYSLGAVINKELGLNTDNDLTIWFNSNGVYKSDDMYDIIARSYHRYLNNRNLNVYFQLNKKYKYGK